MSSKSNLSQPIDHYNVVVDKNGKQRHILKKEYRSAPTPCNPKSRNAIANAKMIRDGKPAEYRCDDSTKNRWVSIARLERKAIKEANKDKIARPVNGYMRFVKENRGKVCATITKKNKKGEDIMDVAECGRELGAKWHALPQEARDAYNAQARAEFEQWVNIPKEQKRINKPRRPSSKSVKVAENPLFYQYGETQ